MTTNKIINNWEHLLKEAESEKEKGLLVNSLKVFTIGINPPTWSSG